MDFEATIEASNDENEGLTRVVWWDEERLEDGVFNFTFNRCALSQDNTNFALINTDTNEKVVLWVVHHPNAKFPESKTDGEKVMMATVAAHGSPVSGAKCISLLNEQGGVLTYNKSQRMKWTVTLNE